MSSKSYRAAQQLFQKGSASKIQLKQTLPTAPVASSGGALKRSWWVGGNLVEVDLSKSEEKAKPSLRKAFPSLR